MRTEFIYSLAALSAIPVVANADAEAYKADKVQTVGTASDVELAVGTLEKGNYTVTSAAISGADLTVKVMAGGKEFASGETKNGKEISLNFVAENQLTDVKIVLVHTTKTVTVPAPVVTLKFDFAGIANKLQIEHNKLTQALEKYEYDKTDENTAAVGYYDRIVAISAADYKFYVDNTEGVQSLYENQSDVTGMALYNAIQETFTEAKGKEKTYQQNTLGPGDGLLGQYDKTYLELKNQYGINYVTDALTGKKEAAWDAYNTYIADVTNFDNRTAAKNAIAAYKTALDEVVSVKKDNEEANTELLKALNSVYGADNSYYDQTLDAIDKNYDDKDNRYAELKGELTAALAAIVDGDDYNGVKNAIKTSYEAKKAKADKNTLINQIATFKQKITQTVSDFNALKDQLAAAYTTYDEQKASADELIKNAPDDLKEEKQAVETAVSALKTFIEKNDTKEPKPEEGSISELTEAAIKAKVDDISAKKVAYSDQKAKYDKYTAVKASVDAKTAILNDAVTAADTYAKDEKGLPQNLYKPSTSWATTINAITTQINALLGNVETNKWNAADYEKSEAFTTAMAAITTATNNFVSRAKTATDLGATIYTQLNSATAEKTATLAISGIDQLNVWTNQVTTDPAIQARTPYETVIKTTIAGHITDWTTKLQTAVQKTGQYDDTPNADNTGNILGYLQSVLESLGGDASKVLADDIATLKAIQLNYQKDEKAFLDQVDQQQIEGIKTMINTKATEFEEEIAKLQKRIDDGEFGKIKGGLLQTEINAISKKINDATAVAAKQDATKAEVSAAYNAIKVLNDAGKDIPTAKQHATDYAAAFAAFTANYNTLNGTENDDENAQTVYGLKAKVKAQKDAIDGLANLSADQKTALKAKVDAVKVVKPEGEPAVDVTYTIATIDDFIKEAWQNERLTDDEVAKYQGNQGIIEGLKAATNHVAEQATRLNVLEGNLAAIDFNAAKTAILAKDPNTEGFFVVNKLLGNEKAGQCTFDFNKIKSDIEADEDITPAELTSYNNQINALKGVINGLPALAEANLNALNAAKKAYSDNKPEKIEEQGAVQRYEYYVATLKAKRQTTALEGQLATLATLKEALDQLMADAEAHYAAGTASATDKDNIDNKANEIKGKFDEYYNEVNYNAQIAADNLAQYNLIKDAKTKVQQTYDDVAASVINAYKNFKSEELQSATAQAQAELENLLDYLVGYDELVNGDQGIWTRADAAYKVVVSPDKFDGAPYVAEFEVVNGQIQSLTTALLEKIEPLFADAVSKSVNSYSEAITISKAKVAKFSATDKDLTEAQLNAIFEQIDGKLNAIKAVKDDADKLAKLDAALVAAADAKNGINALITTREQAVACGALVELLNEIPNHEINLQEKADKDSYNAINNRLDSYEPSDRQYCVANFSTMKAELQRLKAVAEKYAADQAAITKTRTAIETATKAVNGLVADYDDFAAGYEVKADVEAVMNELAKYPYAGVTAENAEAWKAAAEAIPGAVTEVYNKLFDKEVVAIEALIKQAKEENLTYQGGDPNWTKEALSAGITAEEGKLSAAKADVARDPKDAQYKTKVAALTDGTYANNLKNVELMLNGYIKTMTDGNGTNIDQAILEVLNGAVDTQNNRLATSYNSLTNATYTEGIYYKNYSTTAAVENGREEIETSIIAVQKYIGDHDFEIAAYKSNVEAMLADINTALDNFEILVNNEKEKQYLAFVAADNQMIADKWAVSDKAIADAQAYINFMDSQLSQYGSADKYVNKVGKLKDQITAANAVLAAAKTAAESLNTLRRKYQKANSTINAVNAELADVEQNCKDIVTLAKNDYIDAFIEGLNAQIIADTWNNSSNYTPTDKLTLTGEREALVDYVKTLKADAEGRDQAEDIQLEVAPWINKGVITTLNEGAAQFATDLAKLKQDLKDMSLAEDVKGHIIPGKEKIDTEDMEALADIIINGEEATADNARCDVNGDNEIDVTDLVWLRYFLVHGEWPNAQAPAGAPALHTFGNGGIDNVTMEATANGNITRVAINLTNETVFKHFQLNLQLPMGAKVVGQRLGERVEGANLLIAQNDNEVRMLAVSTANNVFAGNEGAVVYLDIENLTGDVNIEKVIFVDTALNSHRLNAGETTGIADRISNAIENAGQKIYDLGGRLMNGVKKGINIIRNADGSTKKVINK